MTLSFAYTHNHTQMYHGVATISRLVKIIGLFCRISSLSLGSFAKETYHFKEPTTCSHPICIYTRVATCQTQQHARRQKQERDLFIAEHLMSVCV